MIIVADTTPISELTKVGYLDLLPTMFGEVIIPEAVFNELKVGRHPAAVIVSFHLSFNIYHLSFVRMTTKKK